VCDIIMNKGKARGVYVLTITKTRSKRWEIRNILGICFLTHQVLVLKA
jgi:hypothetical protein